MKPIALVLLAVSVAAAAPPPPAPPATLSAGGSAETRLDPDFMRVVTVLQERGTRVPDMLRSASARAVALAGKLRGIGATSTTTSEPDVSPVAPDRPGQSSVERLKRIKLQLSGEDATVQVRVTAVFPLPAPLSAAALQASELRRKIGDLVKPADDADPDEDDRASSSAAGTPKPNQPLYVYGRRLSEDVLKPILKAAYANTESNARALADAAGRTLGPLQTLTGQTQPESELTSSNLEPLPYRATCSANFELR